MTKLAVLHLSDIHIKGAKNQSLSWPQQIANSCFEHLRNADACLIAITGDIAFSGKESEYDLARDRLIFPLVSAIERETEKPVYLAVAPGNHDCELIPSNVVRETLIASICQDPSLAEKDEITENCTTAQTHFFKFITPLIRPEVNLISKLFWQQEFTLHGEKILVSTLNAAWMSRLKETQGQLVFPINKFETQLSKESALHLALVHHPLNWYAQEAYQKIRQRLRQSSTAVLSGHEHIPNSGQITETLTGSSIFFEAAALEPEEPGTSPGYCLHVFDLKERTVTTHEYSIRRDVFETSKQPHTQDWKSAFTHNLPTLTESFAARLNDSGGNFTHPAKERINLDDIYIWPEIKNWDAREPGKQRTQNSSTLPKQLSDGGKIILYGEETSGKSTLLFKSFSELLARGITPVYLNAPDINIRSEQDAAKQIKNAEGEQYSNPEIASKTPKAQRVLLVDNVDRLKSGTSGIHHLLNYAERHFSGIGLTASSSFEVTNLVSKDAMNALAPYTSFDISRFGLKLRLQLIKKWCGLSGFESKIQLDKKVHDVESLVNAVIGKKLVPEYPLYLLILLQSAEQHQHGELKNSGLGHYYQYLITKSLSSVKVKATDLDEHFNYLSHLAWHFQKNSSKELDFTEIQAMTREYSARFFTVEVGQRLELLERARILMRRGDCYSFTYPYIYYYFIGHHLAKHVNQPETRAWIEDSCKKLYLHDRAHAIMFLTHHSKDSWVIELICNVLRDCFSEKKPIELNGDTAFLNELVERSTQLTIESTDVDQNQERAREIGDELAEVEQEDENEAFDSLSFTSKWNLLHKTAEILGLILKNYYGSLERQQKKAMIVAVFDAPLRATRLWLEAVSTDLERLIQDIKQNETNDKDYTEEEKERAVKRKLFNIMGMVATGAVVSAGSYVATDKLKEDIADVVKNNPTNAYRLIEVASRLLRPSSIPLAQIKTLANELEGNHYAFGVLQSLGYIHMHMYHTEEQQKQSLCDTLRISIRARKNILTPQNRKTLR